MIELIKDENESVGAGKVIVLFIAILAIAMALICFAVWKNTPEDEQVQEDCDDCVKFVSESDLITRGELNIILDDLDKEILNREIDIINCYDFGGKPIVERYPENKALNYWSMGSKIQCKKGNDVFEFVTSAQSNWEKVK